jgi:hypothetical protein
MTSKGFTEQKLFDIEPQMNNKRVSFFSLCVLCGLGGKTACLP